MNTSRQVAWEWLDRPGLEVTTVRQRLENIVIDGHVVAAWDASVLRLRYHLRCDTHWRVEEARIDLDASSGHRRMVSQRDGDGWRVRVVGDQVGEGDGSALARRHGLGLLRRGQRGAELRGCEDIDIMATPFTNTLPIRRLSWQLDQARDLRMVYVSLPSLDAMPMSQRYTRLVDDASAQRRFRYHAIESGFTADLTVDDDGLVLDYPPYWRQIRHDPRYGD